MNIKNVKIPSDLIIMLIWTLLTIIFILSPILDNTIIRTILGLPFVLFIPGYVLVAALFPKKDDLDSIERIALSFGLSIAVVPLLGLGLNFTFGIRLFQILMTLSIYIFAIIVISIYRRNELSEDKRFAISKFSEIIKNELKTESRIDRILTIVLILSIISAMGMLIYVIVTPKIGEKFTEFYILGKGGKADNYPTKLINDTSENITIGVINHEYIPINYTIDIRLDNISLKKENLFIGNNETWEKNISFIPNKIVNETKLEFQLFREDNFTVPYRDLHLWINVTEKQPEIEEDEDE